MSTPAAIARRVTQEQRDVILGLNMERSVRRPGIAGRPFHIPANLNSRVAKMSFSEDLILGMINDGLLYATQATGPLPGRPEGVKFSARLSKLGFQVRACLIDSL
ncbi:hypothetical protein [Brevundimonas sp.]|uniref:hypothetical protein n=1 Tax=Brevundimonas sp. TaxID=1871086 RepID=UPI002FC86C92